MKKKKKINGPWEDVSGHFSSIQWKEGGIDGRVSPQTGSRVALGVGMLDLDRFVEDDPWWGGAGFPDDVSHILVGRSTDVVSVRWWEVLRYVFLTVITRGRLLTLGVNPFAGVHCTGFVDGDCPWDLSLGQRTGNEEI